MEAMEEALGAYAIYIANNGYNNQRYLKDWLNEAERIIVDAGLPYELDRYQILNDPEWFREEWDGPYKKANIEDIGFQIFFEYGFNKLKNTPVNIRGYENLVAKLSDAPPQEQKEASRLLNLYLATEDSIHLRQAMMILNH